jgi:DNA-binding CsgD family transcriptional regulator
MPIMFRDEALLIVDSALEKSPEDLIEEIDRLAYKHFQINVMAWVRIPFRWFDFSEYTGQYVSFHASVPLDWIEEWRIMIKTQPDIDLLYGFTTPFAYTNADIRRDAHLTGTDEFTLILQQRYGIWDTLICPISGRFLFAYWSKKKIDLEWHNKLMLQVLGTVVCMRIWRERRVSERHEDPHLTPRETSVLRAYSIGADQSEVAKNLNLKVQTVKDYLQNARKKLQARTTTEAVANAIRMRLIQ